MYEWACRYCDVTIEGTTPGEVNTEGRAHLVDNHRAELQRKFRRQLAGETCQGDGEYVFSTETIDEQGFICPECGYDNLPYYAGKQVWTDLSRR